MEAGICPICEEQLTGGYGRPEFEDDQLYYEWTCPNCNCTGSETYMLTFIDHYDVSDENGIQIDTEDLEEV